jgi:hypothetical protein
MFGLAISWPILKLTSRRSMPPIFSRLTTLLRSPAPVSGNAEEMSDTQLSFIAAYNELDSEVFDDDDGKNLLCVFAVIYNRIFEDAPKPPQRYGQHKRDGIRALIVPLLNRACSGIKGYSHATHDAWVEKAHKEMQEDEEAKLLESLYSYVRSLPFSKDWTP